MLSSTPSCSLPDVPGPLPPAIGFPTQDGVFISKSDWAQLIARDVGVRQWMMAAQSCLETR